MSKSYRITTTPGVDQNIQVLIEQDFDFLEILSLKITQSEIYARMCSDYGVVVGRVIANSGYGIPNAKISVFVPLSDEDELNPVISTLYPYKSLTDRNEEGYRYNLLPYIQSYSNHTPTGTFPSRNDVLVYNSLIEVYDKYYKFTVTSNQSGDFMIFGVPVGAQVLTMDLDLSDMGPFSLSPQDLIRMGRATPEQVDGVKFKRSNNLESLPQIVNINKEIEVLPFWGQPEICQFSITRTDFDLVKEANIEIQPTAVFMGSLISTNDTFPQKKDCKPKLKSGQLCSLETGPGEILAIRQTIFNDTNGRPILEQYVLENAGQVIDDNGTWLVDLPMNMDYVYTDQFGNQVISNDPNVGIPTTSKYRFKVKWQQSPFVKEQTKRGYFLVPNIREYGWTGSGSDPKTPNPNSAFQKSYAFSLDWSDYGDTGTTLGLQMITDAINCDDKFYQFTYNKVYTISQLITQYRKGRLGSRFIGIKHITDDKCESENNPFPTNDSNFRFDILFLLFMLFMNIMKPVLFVLLIVAHVLAFVLSILVPILKIIVSVIFLVVIGVCKFVRMIISAINALPGINLSKPNCPNFSSLNKLLNELDKVQKIFTNLKLPLLSYPDCELCDCSLTITPIVNEDPSVPKPPPSGGFLYPFQFPLQYTSHDIDGDSANQTTALQASWWAHMYAGMNGIQKASAMYSGAVERIPGYYPWNLNYNDGFFSTSIPYPEMMNLFNAKSKYYDSDNGGSVGGQQQSSGGWNQIKVSINPAQNAVGAGVKHHYDKPLVIITTQDQVLTSGQLLSFQDPLKSGDPHLTGGTFNDEFGVNAVTGTVISANTILLTYADQTDENNPVANQVLYNLVPQSGETIDNVSTNILLHKFPTDIEYFQVITGMSYYLFYSEFNQTFPPYSLLGRLEGDRIVMKTGGLSSPASRLNGTVIDTRPLTGATDLANAKVYILFRGVDPYSTRQPMDVDISRILGYDYGTKVVSGRYKLNWPIQPSLKLPNHRSFNNNTTASGQAGDNTATSNLNRILFPSLSYDPGFNTGGTSMWTAYTTNLHTYYCDSDTSWLTNNPAFNTNYSLQLGNIDVSTVGGLTIPAGYLDVGALGTTGSQGEFRINSRNLYTFYFPFVDPNISNSDGWYSAINFTPSPFFLNNSSGINLGYWPVNSFPSLNPSTDFTKIYYSQDTNYQARSNSVSPHVNRNFGGRGKGYWVDPSSGNGEYVEGCSAMAGNYKWKNTYTTAFLFDSYVVGNKWVGGYASKIYNSGFTITMSDKANIVMRSERLPSSTSLELSSPCYTYVAPPFSGWSSTNPDPNYYNEYVLHQNAAFEAFLFGDDGSSTGISPSSSGGFSFQQQDSFTSNTIDRALDSFSCGNMYPLECYSYDQNNSTIQVGPNSPNYPDCIQFKPLIGSTKTIFVQGSCYQLVTSPLQSLVKDIKLLTEWVSRMIINFGACQDVWSHLFVNNWINGTLYAFAFRNDSIYSGLSVTNPIRQYCEDTIVLHNPSNNFYYRSSPWNNTSQQFVGKNRPQNSMPQRGFGNEKNLLFPTTILDMGPRNDYLSQISFNTDYDGYYMNEMKSTTFSDVSDLLNYMILSRMISTRFLAQLFSSQGANIFSYFTRFGRNFPRTMFVDADYAQLISINSEIGVETFDPENYPDPPTGPPPVYFNGGNTADAVIGVFFYSDSQIRDYVTPRRKLINSLDPVPLAGAFQTTTDFYYIQTKSQLVPFYKWRINTGGSIFGDQQNNWNSNPTNFFAYKYQNLDRLDYPAPPPAANQYMMSTNPQSMNNFKGYIFSTDANNPANFSSNLSSIQQSSSPIVMVGAPFFFYFGLKKGKSAFNRFSTKWIEGETI